MQTLELLLFTMTYYHMLQITAALQIVELLYAEFCS
jgi:hypothetical protein